MGKLLFDSSAVGEKFQAPSPTGHWRDPQVPSVDSNEAVDVVDQATWENVTGLQDQQRRRLQRIHQKGVLWKNPDGDSSPAAVRSVVFRLSHGGDVDPDGNCLFTASMKAMRCEIDARELRRRTVKRFSEDLGSLSRIEKEKVDDVIKHMYSPDLKSGWGIHVIQEVKLLARKEDREGLDAAINELVDLGMQR